MNDPLFTWKRVTLRQKFEGIKGINSSSHYVCGGCRWPHLLENVDYDIHFPQIFAHMAMGESPHCKKI